ncbi:hypothetical protein F5Y09DRAFT_226239 [Xylaria sp. FL1042]|nr:hypothetical protein F5Y09DRAFT_226239 [Xylaria sp. FL1042]
MLETAARSVRLCIGVVSSESNMSITVPLEMLLTTRCVGPRQDMIYTKDAFVRQQLVSTCFNSLAVEVMQSQRAPSTIEGRLKVMRKRRGKSLEDKLSEYAELFNLNVTCIAQNKISGEYELFEPEPERRLVPC